MIRLFDYGGFPPEANYLFLGDYVDRGNHNLETICLLCRKVVLPLEAKDHACPLKVYAKASPHKKLACFDFETSAHPDRGSKHDAIFISCFFETNRIGDFH